MKLTGLIFCFLSVCFIQKAIGQANRKTLITHKLFSYTIKRHFSDTKHNDTFYIELSGNRLTDSSVIFTIADANSKIIFKEHFKAADLLYNTDGLPLTISQQADTIKYRMAHFFDSKNFSKPAIKSGEKFDIYTSDKNNWNDIKSDSTAIRFTYNYGYEGTYGIAFSKRKRKVLAIFYSD